jgi:hypothetical protein
MIENSFYLPSLLVAKISTIFGYAIGTRIWLLQWPRVVKYGFGEPFDYAIGVSLTDKRNVAA